MKSKYERFVKLTERIMQEAVDNRIARLQTEDERFDGPTMTVEGTKLIDFGSCSYLGLNRDERLKAAAQDAVDRYGPNYSSSTVYTSLGLNGELEDRLSRIFGAPSLVAPTTTLAHLGTLPVLAFPGDLVLLDQNAHATLHLTADVLRGRGVQIETVAHNDVTALRDRLETAANDYARIWYVADGLYSMFGDFAPAAEIAPLLDEFPNLHVYYDDAHSVGWLGHHGRGHILNEVSWHPRMVIAAGLAKSFGAHGAVLAFGTEEMRRRVLLCGSTFTFSGPVQVASLGAAIASADIHLSDELATRQGRLSEQIDLVRSLLEAHNLPVVSLDHSPIWFVRIGPTDATTDVIRGLMDDGFYTNPASYPALPLGSAGVRFTHTLYHSDQDLEALIGAIARRVALVGKDDGVIDLTDTAMAQEASATTELIESNT
ncbi:MAG: aminotransferase class I/II-fold pyridoxal phosphate-dependent enzyme [bacterium]|nr:aminotransferase class I/II-fold pyridoxal phosphate-dependent enzyme [bacterium]MCP4963829.1 aminotransferase class I/II-fold pyridoxal phosphate-dependent enzyme [bacterium]